jgi:hypothetical protein
MELAMTMIQQRIRSKFTVQQSMVKFILRILYFVALQDEIFKKNIIFFFAAEYIRKFVLRIRY